MKRLIELPPDDHLMARAQELVKALGPTQESEERLRRVRRALDAPPQRGVPRWGLGLALATALVGASAAAAAGGDVLAAFTSNAPVTPTPSAAASVKPAGHRSPAPAPKPVSEPASSTATPETAAAAPPRSLGPRPVTASSSDVARVHEAAMALRHEGDPTRALRLLEEKPVSGPLAEEALVLRIEASKARHDGQTAKLAAQYLQRYPNGRYRDTARTALGRAP